MGMFLCVSGWFKQRLFNIQWRCGRIWIVHGKFRERGIQWRRWRRRAADYYFWCDHRVWVLDFAAATFHGKQEERPCFPSQNAAWKLSWKVNTRFWTFSLFIDKISGDHQLMLISSKPIPTKPVTQKKLTPMEKLKLRMRQGLERQSMFSFVTVTFLLSDRQPPFITVTSDEKEKKREERERELDMIRGTMKEPAQERGAPEPSNLAASSSSPPPKKARYYSPSGSSSSSSGSRTPSPSLRARYRSPSPPSARRERTRSRSRSRSRLRSDRYRRRSRSRSRERASRSRREYSSRCRSRSRSRDRYRKRY